MLVPAKLFEAELQEARKQALLHDPGRFRFYRADTSVDWHYQASGDGDWGRIERASVRLGEDGQPQVLGLCGAAIAHDLSIATELMAWSARPSLTYARDLRAFADAVLERVLLVRFSCIVGNPAERHWRRWVAERDGRCAGYLTRWGRLEDGTAADARVYEVPGRLQEPTPQEVRNKLSVDIAEATLAGGKS